MLSSSELTKTFKTYPAQHPRLINHLVLAGITVMGGLVAAIFASPGQAFLESLSVGTGYVGLLLILATLLIGPLNMLKVRKNPLNLNIRRDVGIWAGISSLAHVAFSAALQLSWGDSLLGFFFYENGGGLKLNLFGISNFFGLVAALVVLFLMVLSNNYFLKKLKGKSWKKMQRFNYLLFVVTLVHAFTQQANNERGALLTFGVIALAAVVLIAQSIGFVVYRQRAQQRQSAATKLAAKPAVKVAAQAENYGYAAGQSYKALPKVGLVAAVGLISAFAGFELFQQGSELVNTVAHVNSASTTTTISTISTTNNSTSSTSSSVQVSQASSTQPQIRTGHS